jgi:hypothetical protein
MTMPPLVSVRGWVHSRERGALLVAALLHVVVVGVARSRPILRDARESAVTQALPEIDIVVTSREQPPSRRRERPEVPASVEQRGRAETLQRGRREGGSLEGRAAAPTVDGVASSLKGNWRFSPTVASGPREIGLGAARFRVPVPEAEPEGNGALSLRDDHDVSLGLGRGGRVRSAVEEVVQSSQAGTLGMAVFDITLDPAGKVRVELVDSKGDSSPWADLREPIATLVASKSVSVPPESKGLRVRIHVEAAVKLADGRDVKTLGNGAAASPGRINPEGGPMLEMPSIHIEHRGKVCSERLAIHPPIGDLAATTNFGTDDAASAWKLPAVVMPISLSGGCSLENIGEPARRMVATRVVSETRL